MASYGSLLDRWRKAGVLDAQAEVRIRAFEEKLEKSGYAGIRGRCHSRSKMKEIGSRWRFCCRLRFFGF